MADGEELSLGKDDRLPWLEPVDNEPDEEPVNKGKLAGFLVALLAALGLVLGGLWWIRGEDRITDGNGALIAAPEGPYKTRPADAGGMDVEGQGDAAFAASEGADADGKLDLATQPEVPLTQQRVIETQPGIPANAGQKASAAVTNGGKLVPTKPTIPAARQVVAAKVEDLGTGLVQLGAYGSEASANQAYAALIRRHAFLAGMPKLIAQTNVGGTEFYRLRVTAGARANDVCAQLKAGGTNCIIVK